MQQSTTHGEVRTMRSGGPAVGQAAPLIFVPFFVACLAFYFAGWPKMSDVIVFRNILIQKDLVRRIALAAAALHSRGILQFAVI